MNENLENQDNVAVNNETAQTEQSGVTEPVENVDTTKVSNKDETDDGLVFDDTDLEDVDEESANEEVNKESTKEKKPIETNKSAQQGRNRNKKEAELRKKLRLESFKEAMDVNPYTELPIETEEDIEQYKIMKAMDKEGYDPTSTIDYINFTKKLETQKREEAERNERLANENSIKAKEKMQNELNEFANSHTGVDFYQWLNEIPEDRKGLDESKKKQFTDAKKQAISAFISSGLTINQAYELFNNLNPNLNIDVANKIAETKIKNSIASPGSQAEQAYEKPEPLDYEHMSDEQFNKLWAEEKVKKAI